MRLHRLLIEMIARLNSGIPDICQLIVATALSHAHAGHSFVISNRTVAILDQRDILNISSVIREITIISESRECLRQKHTHTHTPAANYGCCVMTMN